MWIPLQQTPGDKRGYTDPLKDLPGVSGDSKSLEELKKKENELHPLPAPTKDNTPGFDLPPADLTPGKFEAWQPEYQAKYLQKNGTAIQIGKSPNTLDVILSSDKTKAIILNNLDKAGIAKLSTADKKLVAASAYFKNTLAIRLGLTADPIEVGKMKGAVDTAKYGSNITDGQRQIFIDQLEFVRARCADGVIYSVADAQAAISAVENRWKSARVYGKWGSTSNVPKKSAIDGNLYVDVNASDNGRSIYDAFEDLIANEQAIVESTEQGDELAGSGLLGGKKNLSAPELIAFFQLQEQTSKSYQNITNTTLVNGVNETLKDYAMMQSIIQKALRSFPTDAKADTLMTIAGTSADKDPSKNDTSQKLKDTFTDTELRVFCMFENHLTGGSQRNPAEELNNVERRTFDMLSLGTPSRLKGFTRDQFNSMATELSSKVTVLQSNTQSAMDIISNTQQKLTQNFSLANSCLQQGQTIIGTIGQGFVGG